MMGDGIDGQCSLLLGGQFPEWDPYLEQMRRSWESSLKLAFDHLTTLT